ncbi:hypothetical protein Ancab_039461 [Ancistrocladus abbreviatus]
MALRTQNSFPGLVGPILKLHFVRRSVWRRRSESEKGQQLTRSTALESSIRPEASIPSSPTAFHSLFFYGSWRVNGKVYHHWCIPLSPLLYWSIRFYYKEGRLGPTILCALLIPCLVSWTRRVEDTEARKLGGVSYEVACSAIAQPSTAIPAMVNKLLCRDLRFLLRRSSRFIYNPHQVSRRLFPPVISPEITPLPSSRSVSDEFSSLKRCQLWAQQLMLPPHQTFVKQPPPANNTIEEELAQLQRRLEEKEASAANLTARMVGVNNQAQQVAGPSSNKWLVRPNNQRGTFSVVFGVNPASKNDPDYETMPNSITELRDFILKNVQDFHHHVSRPSYRYRKPYPTWIDSVPFRLEQDLATTFYPVAERPLRMEHYVFDNLCNHSKELSWFYQTSRKLFAPSPGELADADLVVSKRRFSRASTAEIFGHDDKIG